MKKIVAIILALVSVLSMSLITASAEGEATVTDIWVITNPNKMTYYLNETLDLTGLKIGVSYSDGVYAEVDSGIECDTTVLKHKGTIPVVISYGGEPETINVTVEYSTVQKVLSMINYLLSFFKISFENIIAWF